MWLIGNWPYRFLQITFLDLFIVTVKEIQDWAGDEYYLPAAAKTSAILGILFIIAVLLGAVIWLWVGILPAVRKHWPRPNSEIMAGLRPQFWSPIVYISLFFIS